jgi:Sulfatase-modifying factor enzyme 1
MDKHPAFVKFLPLCVRGIHTAFPLARLEPDAIRSVVDNVKATCPPGTASNTLLNAVASGVGLARGWAEYHRACEETLTPFLKKNGLITLRRLLGEDYGRIVRLTYRQIADRLFVSGRPRPVRLFTGVGFNNWQFLELALKQQGLTVRMIGERNSATSPLDQSFVPNSYRIHGGGKSFGLYTDFFPAFSNLIGDQLCDYTDTKTTAMLALAYNVQPREAERLEIGLSIFRRLIMSSQVGWVRVLRFNDDLAFLADGAGGYDFVFRDLRDAPAPSATPIDGADGSQRAVDEDEAFLVRNYFDYKGWLERDQHESEKEFYAAGGTPETHPGVTAVLRDYLARHRKNSPSEEAVHVRAGQVDLTSLVTIKAFKEFLWESGRIGKDQGNDPWLFANGNREEDDGLPVSVSWEDAAAYAKWVNDKGHHRVRLPTEDEYRDAFRSQIPKQISERDVEQALAERLVDFVAPDKTTYEGHPPYMSPAMFARLTLRYRLPLPMRDGRVHSAYFGEWLEPKGAAINGLFFCAQYAVADARIVIVSPARARFPADSTGKYKGMKIGFRLAILD